MIKSTQDCIQALNHRFAGDPKPRSIYLDVSTLFLTSRVGRTNRGNIFKLVFIGSSGNLLIFESLIFCVGGSGGMS